MTGGVRMEIFKSRTRILFFLILCLSSACLPSKKLTVGSTAMLLEEVAKSSSKQSDLRLIREGTPGYLMLIDGMVESWPDNERLLLAAIQGYASFASIVLEEQEMEYAKLLFEKGKSYTVRALERIGVKAPLSSPFDDFRGSLTRLGKREVPYLFWGATCWASWINLNLDSTEALAELPRVESMMRRVLEIDEGFYYGGPHLFMGILYASRPKIYGGDLKRAREHFLRALDLGRGKFLMAYVYYANYYARQTLEKDFFVSTLRRVLEIPADISPDLVLLNTLAKKKAKAYLERVDEYFD
jgi:hypothetical protein